MRTEATLMNSILEFVLATLIYPGAVVAFLAAWVLAWARDVARELARGAHISNPLASLASIRGLFARETLTPAGVNPVVISAGVALMVAAPFVALVMLPLPGNPLTQVVGLRGDLIA